MPGIESRDLRQDSHQVRELVQASKSDPAVPLDRELADRRIFPSFDLVRSGTRREELLLTEPELKQIWRLRREVANRKPLEAMEALLAQLEKTKTNEEFLKSLG